MLVQKVSAQAASMNKAQNTNNQPSFARKEIWGDGLITREVKCGITETVITKLVNLIKKG